MKLTEPTREDSNYPTQQPRAAVHPFPAVMRRCPPSHPSLQPKNALESRRYYPTRNNLPATAPGYCLA